MSLRADISVIICTRNNADSLAKTLSALDRIRKSKELSLELIVVDNASTDGTFDIVRNFDQTFQVKYIYEPEIGLSRARNSGLKAAGGDVILFTDDDVIPFPDWLERMTTPLLRKQCDSITGRIQLAKHLMRPWMRPMHDVWLAASRVTLPGLVGACMGFHRTVLEQIPEFDPELGAGALGFSEETLFSDQLEAAGYSSQVIDEACVEHHPSSSRLIRKEWLEAAKKRGRSAAYILYHWEHVDLKFPFLNFCYYQLKLAIRRIIQPPPALNEEGSPEWEISYIAELEKYRGFMKERTRLRNYDKKGLRKKIQMT